MRADDRPRTPAPAQSENDPSPLGPVDQAFHQAYSKARNHAARVPPILVVLGDHLVLVMDGEEARAPVTPAAYHVVKAVAHAPLAAFILACDAERRGELEALFERLTSARAKILACDIDPAARRELVALAQCTTDFVHERLRSGPNPKAAARFAREAGPRLLRATSFAVALQLGALERAERTLVSSIAPDRRLETHVVVAGAHQARERSLGMQYFLARLQGPDVADRVTYAENVTDIAGAVKLVGTRALDRQLALSFFGDPKRLERDILGDAVAAVLARPPHESETHTGET